MNATLLKQAQTILDDVTLASDFNPAAPGARHVLNAQAAVERALKDIRKGLRDQARGLSAKTGPTAVPSVSNG